MEKPKNEIFLLLENLMHVLLRRLGHARARQWSLGNYS
jgi:hypothetical protein